MNSNQQHNNKTNLIIAFTGSVATIKSLDLVKLYLSSDLFNIKLVVTQRGKHFLTPFIQQLQQLQVEIYCDEDEWKWTQRGDPVLHIELRKWAQVMVIAPLSANTMAKIVHGLSDNLVTCIVRAWDFNYPLIVCPAMNTLMYNSNITAKQLKQLEEMNVIIIDSIEKKLMCGDIGKGAMEEINKIVEKTLQIIQK